ncbi:MAG: ankyrin repeat domain-containing protein [Planctomycetes bacterium]|nr:ankyrin repeat domain-containing protein [Planctomycetota bacterium]
MTSKEETAISDLIDAAMRGDRDRVDMLLDGDPTLGQSSIHAMAAIGDEAAVRRLLEDSRDAGIATEPRSSGYAPLVYACCARLGAGASDMVHARVAIAAVLLDAGADPDAGMRESESLRGYRTALGGAIDCVRSADLAALLLERGGDPADGPTLYEGTALWAAVGHRDHAALRVLLGVETPHWQICHALPHAMSFCDVTMIDALLGAGADPDWQMGPRSFQGTCLHEAAHLGSSPGVVASLLAHGARVDAVDRDGRTPLAIAVRWSRTELVRMFREHGATEAEVRPVDRWFAACLREDADAAQRVRDEAGAFVVSPSDAAWIVRAIREQRFLAARLLVEGGLPVDVADDDGTLPLHAAVEARQLDLVERLLVAGADVDARDFEDRTALDIAIARSDGVVIALLEKHGARVPTVELPTGASKFALFEAAADHVVEGDLDGLCAMLAKDPWLVHARSPRTHRVTLLHYLGANGVETERQKTPPNAVAMCESLLGAGADPNTRSYTYRGGPGSTTIGLLTSSSHPREAGLTLPLVAALARHGAELDAGWSLLVALHESARSGMEVPAIDPETTEAQHALIEAVRHRDVAIALRILDAGVDVNAAADGVTSLHHAAIDGHAAMVDLLLARGADPTLRDSKYRGTASGWARAGGHLELARRLADIANGI